MPVPSQSREIEGQTADSSIRLDCWKEIAGYLGRGERTVKRWETDRGLPIHRVPGGGRSSVYAFALELDKWLKASVDSDPGSVAESPLESSEPDELVSANETAYVIAGDGQGSESRQVKDPEASANHLFLVPAAANGVSTDFSTDPEPHAVQALKPARRNRHFLSIAAVLLAVIALSGLGLPGLRKAVAHLSPSPTPASTAKPTKPTTSVSDLEKQSARELYLKGRYEWNERTPDSLNRALDDFTQSIVHDPGYAEAYVGMADTYDLLREYTSMPESDAFSRAILAARKAVELDDSLAEAHRALAFAERYGSWDFVDSEKEFHRAIALNPADPVARRWYANAFAVPGRFEDSIRQMDKAQELDPTSHSTLADKGVMLFNAGRPQEAIAILKEVERTAPEFRSTHFYLMSIGFATRDYPTYLEEGRKTAELSSDPILRDVISAAQSGYTHDGERGLLKNVYTKQRQYFLAHKLWATMLAITCVQMDRKQEALGLLEEAYARHEEYLISSLLASPELRGLNDEPRYKALFKKINFPMLHPSDKE